MIWTSAHVIKDLLVLIVTLQQLEQEVGVAGNSLCSCCLFFTVLQWMVVGANGHPGVPVRELVVQGHRHEHEPVQTLLHKGAGLTV